MRYIAPPEKDVTPLENRNYYDEKSERFIEMESEKIVDKVWGSEQSIGFEPFYTVKKMIVKPEFTCSLHSHKEKTETFYLIHGILIVETVNTITGNTSVIELTEEFNNITIKPNTPHRFYCPDGQTGDTVFLEVSTAELDNDNYRYIPSGQKKDCNIR